MRPLDLPVLESSRLVLRDLRQDDLDDFARMQADLEVTRFLGGPLDRCRAWRRMAAYRGHWELRGLGLFAVIEKESGRFVGRVGLLEPEGYPGLELAWTLAREHWGRGLAAEAAQTVRDWAWNELGVPRLISLIHPDNLASQRVARSVGEHLEAVIPFEGTPHELWSVPRPAGLAAVEPARCRPTLEVPVIETERLRLRGFREDDLDAMAAIWADPEVLRFIGGATLDRDATWFKLAESIGHWLLRGYGPWAVADRRTDVLLGRIGHLHPEGWPGVEIGWTMAPATWGRGLASEAARAVRDWTWREMDLPCLISLIAPENEPSKHVARAIGERYERTIEILGLTAEVWKVERPG